MNTPEIRLHALRAELDEIDHTLRQTLVDRMTVCHRIGELKREHGIAVMQPGRIDEVIAGARAHALAHGLSPDYLSALYELIIAETCRVEDAVVSAGARDSAADRSDATAASRT